MQKRFRQQRNKELTATDLKEKFSVPTQNFNGVAGSAISITGTKGTKIDFPSNAFLDANGNAVTGNIKLSLKEVLSKRDIILSGKTTESNGQLLITGGEIQIVAIQNGRILKLNPAVDVAVKVPTVLNTQPMNVFTFEPTATSDSTWVLNQKSRVTQTPQYYEFNLPNFGWINCDFFYSNPNPKTTVTANPTHPGASPSIKDQRAFLVFNTIVSVANMPYQTSINKHQSYLNSMPIGLTGKIVIIAVDMADKIHFGSAPFTVTAGLNVNVPLTVGTQSDLDNMLNSL